jgi:peptidyl-prolyl cis-trans isomerase A (cyclophilin A)
MKILIHALSLGLLASGIAFAQQQPATAKPDSELPDAPAAQANAIPIEPTGPTAVFDTSMGRITCKLFSAQAPNTVANFVGLAEGSKDWTDPISKIPMHNKPFYDGTTFHRVIPGFMIQGGDPTATGSGDAGYMFANEIDPNLNFDVAGRLAMANSGPDTNGSQFFITEAPEEHLDHSYTIFGQCDPGSLPVVETIARVERDSNDKPLRPVVLNKVTIVPAGEPLPSPPAAPQDSSASQPAPQAAPQN